MFEIQANKMLEGALLYRRSVFNWNKQREMVKVFVLQCRLTWMSFSDWSVNIRVTDGQCSFLTSLSEMVLVKEGLELGEGIGEGAVVRVLRAVADLALGEGVTVLALGEGVAALALGEGVAALALGEGVVALVLGEGVADLALGEGVAVRVVRDVAALALGEGVAALALGESCSPGTWGRCCRPGTGGRCCKRDAWGRCYSVGTRKCCSTDAGRCW